LNFELHSATIGKDFLDWNAMYASSTGSNKTDWLRRAIDVMTVVVLIAGLALGLHQASLAVTSGQVASWNDISDRWLDVDKLFVDNPTARKFVYGNIDIDENNTDNDKTVSVANVVLDFIDYAVSTYYILTKQNNGLKTIIDNDYDGWKHYFKSQIFSKSPLICRIIRKDPGSYNEKTVELANDKDACPEVKK
jgi:hypothetical protein